MDNTSAPLEMALFESILDKKNSPFEPILQRTPPLTLFYKIFCLGLFVEILDMKNSGMFSRKKAAALLDFVQMREGPCPNFFVAFL